MSSPFISRDSQISAVRKQIDSLCTTKNNYQYFSMYRQRICKIHEEVFEINHLVSYTHLESLTFRYSHTQNTSSSHVEAPILLLEAGDVARN